MRKIHTNFPPSNTQFMFSNKNNFIVVWNGLIFGVADGKGFNSCNFKSDEDEIKWLTLELLFIEGIKEKIEEYKKYMENKNEL